MQRTLAHLFIPRKSNNHRSRLLHPEAYVVFIGILLGSQVLVSILSKLPGSFPAILGFSSSITVSTVVEQTNAQRLSQGLSSLTLQPSLSNAAVAKGKHMCAEQYWAHISPAGVTPWVFMKDAGYRYSVAGENLARDFSDTDSMVRAWMASPTHKANIVNSKYKDIGVAVVDCKFLGTDTTLVIQMFGSALVPSIRTAVKSPSVSPTPLALVKAEMTENDLSAADIAGADSVPIFIQDTDSSLSLPTPAPISSVPALFTPLQVTKAISLSVLATLLLVLFIDMWVSHRNKVVRIAGRNFAHMLFLSGILLVVLIVKSGLTL